MSAALDYPPLPHGPAMDDLHNAIIQTVAYADVFDFPLTPSEVHRYLVGVPASLPRVEQFLANGHVSSALVRHQGYVMLRGREEIVAVREQRAQIAQRLWVRARRYGAIIAGLPFVRMVAVTGSLAVDNAEEAGDIDYLIVTAPDRLWLCRALVITVVRWAARRGDVVCPNYFLSERSLQIEQGDIFLARELAQMVPIAGLDVYNRIRQLNSWSEDFLPNAAGPPAHTLAFPPNGRHVLHRLQPASEAVLRTRLGASVEAWEMNRKIRKFRAQYPNHDEAAFSPDWCKGHFDGHAHRIMDAFNERLHTIDEVMA